MHDGQTIMRMKHIGIWFWSILGQSRLVLYCMVLSISANDINLPLEGGVSCMRISFQQCRSGRQSIWQICLVRYKLIQSAQYLRKYVDASCSVFVQLEATPQLCLFL